MPSPFADDRDASFLATFRPARMSFRPCPPLPPAVASVWAALRKGETRAVVDASPGILRDEPAAPDARAALYAGLAHACCQQSRYDRARQLARQSLDVLPGQWLARRVLLDVLFAEHEYADALALVTGDAPDAGPVWDEPLAGKDRLLVAAACAWLLGRWNECAGYLAGAFPDGVRSMPAALQEDWFRLAFYREAPADAADAACVLIAGCETSAADVLLQTLVKQGWNHHALALYRALYEREPSSELLRRRLVGLCIREGDVDGARKLMERGALKLTTT